MNCEKFNEIIGMRCNPVGSAIEIVTPFSFLDGNGIELFAQDAGSQIHFFDDGCTLLHLHSAGIRFGNDNRKLQPLRNITSSYGVNISDVGVIETLCSKDKASIGFANIVSALLGVASWEREQNGVSMDDSWLVDEVAMYLRAWKPSENLIKNPIVRGFSGRKLSFDFEMGGEYIDAISPHFASTGAELRKIVDLNSSSQSARKEVLVIVDDRSRKDLAKQEIDILGRISKAWPMSSLISAVGTTIQAH